MKTPYIPTREFLKQFGFYPAQFQYAKTWPKSYSLPDSPSGIKYDLIIAERGTVLLYEMHPDKIALQRRYQGLPQSDAFMWDLLYGVEWPIKLPTSYNGRYWEAGYRLHAQDCSTCGGSGEHQHPNLSCDECNGSGVMPADDCPKPIAQLILAVNTQRGE